jgi:FtsH-binding integral membrane protein
MSILRMIYLALAVVGAIVPMYFFISWFMEFGWSLSAMAKAWNVNDATSGLVWDLTIAAIALTVFVIAESWVRRDWLGLVAIPATFCIGVSCGLPLYLFLRSRPLA